MMEFLDFVIPENVLHEGGIRKAIEEKLIHGEIDEEQFQPNTLDVRIARVDVWDHHEISKRGKRTISLRDAETLEPTISYPEKKDLPILIPPGASAEIHFNVFWDRRLFDVDIELRSGRGRLCQFPYSTLLNPDDPMLSVKNFSGSAVMLYGHDRFAQLFFKPRYIDYPGDGYAVTDIVEALEIARSICDEPPQMQGPYLKFFAKDTILEPKGSIPIIDTRHSYATDELFNQCKLPYLHEPGKAIVVPLRPSLHVPPDVGILLLKRFPYKNKDYMLEPDNDLFSVELLTCMAGWIDSGYSGTVTAHPLRLIFEGMINEGDLCAMGVLYKYNTPVPRTYDGHYQKSDGSKVKS